VNIVDALQQMLDKHASKLLQLVDSSLALPIPLSDTLSAVASARNAEQKRGNWSAICRVEVLEL